ncbi:hypothetical protein PsYK624_046040 [Phanerochaete sordida]|uniref:ubiquitinyl hydrolase 1 n=1 Tax=Phanerochaete sordida TaxID=48140 RepID=A0A9P3G588_9APHY|nr:hypothetical protein PsYK624_046040 [Phanerochaete sordida]
MPREHVITQGGGVAHPACAAPLITEQEASFVAWPSVLRKPSLEMAKAPPAGVADKVPKAQQAIGRHLRRTRRSRLAALRPVHASELFADTCKTAGCADLGTPAPPALSSRSQQAILRCTFKCYLIAVPPPVFVVHLKRFQQVSKTSAYALAFSSGFKSLNDFVAFPEHLDLAPFLAPRKEDFGLGRRAGRDRERERGECCMYRLYAVVVHTGNMTRPPRTVRRPQPTPELCVDAQRRRRQGRAAAAAAALGVHQRHGCTAHDAQVGAQGEGVHLHVRAHIAVC